MRAMRWTAFAVLPPCVFLATSLPAAEPSTLPPLPPAQPAPSERATEPPAPELPARAEVLPPPSPPSAPAGPALTPQPADPNATRPHPASPPPEGSPHDGFYLRLSIGPAFVSATGDGPVGPTSINGGGVGVAAAIGGALTKGLALAATLRIVGSGGTLSGYAMSSATMSAPGVSVTAASAASVPGSAAIVQLGVLADWYPVSDGGWHAGGSIALSGWSTGPSESSQAIAGTSGGGSLFGGYDWWIGRRWSLGLMAVIGTVGRTSLQDTNHNETGYSMMPIFFSVEGSLLFF
jgi:hypothetical protein